MAVAIGRRAGRLVQQLMKQNRKTFYGQLQEHNEAAALLSNYIHRAHFTPHREGHREKNTFLFDKCSICNRDQSSINNFP